METPKLQASAIHMWFHQARLGRKTRVLENIDLTVQASEFVAILGPSGCGKTTLLHILDGLLRPSRGRVRVDGHPVTGPGPDRALVFQSSALFPWRTVLGNIAYGLECLKAAGPGIKAKTHACLELVGLQGFERHFPHELSGGMQQRVNLARALAVDPDILLMDEPFASLDAQTREKMQAELLSIWERTRKTVLFVTHDIAEAIYLADRVLVFTQRPSQIRGEVVIELPRPREVSVRLCAGFRDHHDRIRGLLQTENTSPVRATGNDH